MRDKKTSELLNILKKINDKSTLSAFIDTAFDSNGSISISEYLNSVILEKQLTKSDVIKKSGLQRTYAYQILQGLKRPGRDKLLALCIALEMSLEQVQRGLTIAEEGILYSKDKRDAILIFAINKKLNVMEANELLFTMNEKILE